MSYRNPKQFIDTQSGQHYRNLINSVVKTGDDLAKDIIKQNAEVAKRNNDIITGAEKREQQILSRFGNVTAGNPSFNFGEGFEYYINQYSDLNIAVDTGKSENPVAARRRMAEIEQLPVMAKDGLAGLIEMTEDLIEKADKRGQMGGLDLASIVSDGENTSDLEALLIMADQLRGARSFNIVEENGKLVPAYVLGNRQYTYTQIQNYLAGPESGGVFNSIPDETKSYTEAAKLAMVPDPNDPQKQILNPKYYENQPVQTRVDDKGNTEMLKGEPIGQTLRADAASLSNTDKISFYNNILATDRQFEYGKLLNKEEEQMFIDAYVDYGLNNYVQQQHQVGFIKAPEEPTKTEVEYQEKLENLEERIQASDLFSLEETIKLARGLGIKQLDEVFESEDEGAKLDTIKVGGREITKDMTPAQKKKIILMGLGIKEEDAERISQKKENTQFDSPTTQYKGFIL
jgi:hypothetical protein